MIAGGGGSLLRVDRKRGERDGKKRGGGGRERRKEGREERDGRHLLGQETAVQDLPPSSTILYLLPFPEPLQTAPSTDRHSTQEPVRRMLQIQGVTLRKIMGSCLPESF